MPFSQGTVNWWWFNEGTTTSTDMMYFDIYNQGVTSTTSATMNTYSDVYWPLWTQQVRTSQQNMAWQHWQQNRALANYNRLDNQQVAMPPQRVRTATEIAEAEARLHAARQESARVRRAAEAAIERAEGLLLQFLDPEQVDEYKRLKHIHVCGKSGRRYRIRCDGGLAGNVDVVDELGSIRERLCAHAPRDSYPMPDHILTQVLHLRHSEEEFRRIANRHF